MPHPGRGAMVKVAILNRDRGREGVRAALEDAARGGAALGTEIKMCSRRCADCAVDGVARTVLASSPFSKIFRRRTHGACRPASREFGADCFARGGIGGVPFPVMLDIIIGRTRQRHRPRHEQVSTEILNMVTDPGTSKDHEISRQAKIFCGRSIRRRWPEC